jgi:Rieske 2Fe-2S family protein
VISQTIDRPVYVLSKDAYLSHEWFARERSVLFANRWTLVGTLDDLTNPGDFTTMDVGDAPLLILRDRDGGLRAFQNLCRHRGMKLLEGRGTCDSRIDCFYHHWRYGLDGALEVVPQRKEQFPDLDPAEWGLLPASVDVWEGMVFAHRDPLAAPLAETLAGLALHVHSHRPGQLTEVARVDFDAHCNWKLFVENHIDVYHLWYLHEQSLGALDHTRFDHTFVGTDWFSYEPIRSREAAEDHFARVATISHLDERDRFGIQAHMVFPNLLVAATAEYFITYGPVPVAPDRSRIELRVRAEPGADPDVLVAAAEAFIAEDILACERVQAGIASPAFEVGPLALEHERPITTFHEHLIAALDGAPL